MNGSDFVAFQELTARVEALEATVLRLQERVEGKDMMSDLEMPPETPDAPKKGRDAA